DAAGPQRIEESRLMLFVEGSVLLGIAAADMLDRVNEADSSWADASLWHHLFENIVAERDGKRIALLLGGQRIPFARECRGLKQLGCSVYDDKKPLGDKALDLRSAALFLDSRPERSERGLAAAEYQV